MRILTHGQAVPGCVADKFAITVEEFVVHNNQRPFLPRQIRECAVCTVEIPKVSEYFGAYKNSMFTAGACYNLHCDVSGALSIRRKSGVNATGMWSLSVLDRLVGGRITSHSTPLTQKNAPHEKITAAEQIESVRSYCECEK